MIARAGKPLDYFDQIEAISLRAIVPWLENRGNKVELITNRIQQLKGIDFISTKDGIQRAIELKADATEHTSTIFAEYFADVSSQKIGWLITCQADLLLYHFHKSGKAVCFRPSELREAIYKTGGWLTKLKSVRQYKRETQKITVGYRVSISQMKELKSFTEWPIPVAEHN